MVEGLGAKGLGLGCRGVGFGSWASRFGFGSPACR